ncbi:hypothetical protein [Cohnella herbarum]|uniref:Uncharacterized protein n=1 Tax=Cohnella herbarum TaxID=2728023 RepID=A0A7Z2VH31_9BACL|nr:hypothetical protein [Cohnella herbarum]QJD82917.1 hypothetical protein HH215_06810 [Cohnella herbarum]
MIHNEIIKKLQVNPAPSISSFVMVDMDSRQLLFDDKRVTAIVDTEAYVIGPRELDLVTIECNLTSNGARAFKRGYESIGEFPDLTQCREPYRYFFSLLEVKGPIDYKEWTNTPKYFDCISE